MQALRRLYETARSVAGQSRTVRTAIARLDGVVLAEQMPDRIRDDVMAAIASARTDTAWRMPAPDVGFDLEDPPESIEGHAQTHRAEVDGTPVRVKVGRPGLAASARSDLSLLDLMAGPARAAFPALDAGPLIREMRDRAVDELDFEHEAALQRRVARALRGVEGVRVAPVMLDLCDECTVVAEAAPGRPLAADGAEVARRLLTVFAGAPAAIGMVLADARAAETYVDDDGIVTLQWVGAGREVDGTRLEAAAGAVQALRTGDAETFALAARALGLLEHDDGLRLHALLLEVLGPLATGPAVLDATALRDLSDRALDRADELVGIATRITPHAEDLWALRALAHTASLLSRCQAEEDWLTLSVRALREGWG